MDQTVCDWRIGWWKGCPEEQHGPAFRFYLIFLILFAFETIFLFFSYFLFVLWEKKFSDPNDKDFTEEKKRIKKLNTISMVILATSMIFMCIHFALGLDGTGSGAPRIILELCYALPWNGAMVLCLVMIESWVESIISYKLHFWKPTKTEKVAKAFGTTIAICYSFNILITAIVAGSNPKYVAAAIRTQYAVVGILKIFASVYTLFYGWKMHKIMKEIRISLESKDTLSLRSLEGSAKKTMIFLFTSLLGLLCYAGIFFYQTIEYYNIYDTAQHALSVWCLVYIIGIILCALWLLAYYLYFYDRSEGFTDFTPQMSRKNENSITHISQDETTEIEVKKETNETKDEIKIGEENK